MKKKEPPDKKTLRVLRELAGLWKPGTPPEIIIRSTADDLEPFFEREVWTECAKGKDGAP